MGAPPPLPRRPQKVHSCMSGCTFTKEIHCKLLKKLKTYDKHLNHKMTINKSPDVWHFREYNRIYYIGCTAKDFKDTQIDFSDKCESDSTNLETDPLSFLSDYI